MKVRRGLSLAMVLVLVVAVPILEVWLLVEVAHRIGGLPTVGLLIAGAILGGWLVRREGGRAWAALTEAFGTGRVPSGELADAALVLVGGVLLMLPGFVTDLVGLLFLLPLTRPAARKLVAFLIARRLSRLGVPVTRPRDGGDVIEGETVDAPAQRSADDPVIIRGEVLDR